MFRVGNWHDFILGIIAGIVVVLVLLSISAGLWLWRTNRRARALEEHASHQAGREVEMKKIDTLLHTPGISREAWRRALHRWIVLDNQQQGSGAMWRSRIYARRVN